MTRIIPTTKVRRQGCGRPPPTEDVDDLAKVTDQGGGALRRTGDRGCVLAQLTLTPDATTPHRPARGSHKRVAPSSVGSRRSLPRATTRGPRDLELTAEDDNGGTPVRVASDLLRGAPTLAREQLLHVLGPDVASAAAHDDTIALDSGDGQRPRRKSRWRPHLEVAASPYSPSGSSRPTGRRDHRTSSTRAGAGAPSSGRRPTRARRPGWPEG